MNRLNLFLPRFLFISAILVIIHGSCLGQRDTTVTHVNEKPNLIKLSLSSWLLYPGSLHMGYERMINRNHSIYVFGGYNEFPIKLDINLQNTNFTDAKNRSGYMFGAEYRFYLPKENKYAAPHGIYLAPYVSYYNFSSNNTLTHTDSVGNKSSAELAVSLALFNVGFEMGYQFVISKRFVIDAEMFGPSFSYYTFKASINGNLSGISQSETLQAVIDALKAKFPLLNDLSSGKTVVSSGSASQRFPAVGYRYVISIGYKF